MLETARDRAIATSRVELLVQIRASLAAAFVERGRTAAALAELERAEAAASAAWVGRIITQRAFVLHHLGSFREAIAEGQRAEPHLRRAGDDLGECRLLLNRGISWLAVGELDESTRDLTRSRRLAEDVGQGLIVAAVDHAFAAMAVRRGAVPHALALFQECRERYATVESPARMVAGRPSRASRSAAAVASGSMISRPYTSAPIAASTAAW